MTDGSDSSADDEREVELSSIAAIFPELVRDGDAPYAASIELPVTLAQPLSVLSTTSSKGKWTAASEVDDGVEQKRTEVYGETTAGVVDDHRLTHLPPLSLRLILPEAYPDHEPPRVELSTAPPWLSTDAIERLKADAARLWEELGRSPVVFTYIDHLHQAAETAFRLEAEHDRPLTVAPEIHSALLQFDRKTKRAIFERETFECGICLAPKKGSSCYRLRRCGHVFCVQCLQDFYKSCISEGDVASVKCLDPGCARAAGPGRTGPQDASNGARSKRRRQDLTLRADELREIPLEDEMVARYNELTRKARLEANKNMIYCPRQWCQGPARWKSSRRPAASAANGDPPTSDDDDTEGDDADAEEARVWRDGDPEEAMPPMAERLAICDDCSYAFCRVCLAGWHGELARCWPRKLAELSAEEKATEEYLKQHSSLCPTCNARCQKTMGCNHMVCFKCRSHFCYLCGAWLDEHNPYQHYNTKLLECYLRLWELEGGDGHDAPRHRLDVRPEAAAVGHVDDDDPGVDLDPDYDPFRGPGGFDDDEDDEDEDEDDDIDWDSEPDDAAPPARRWPRPFGNAAAAVPAVAAPDPPPPPPPLAARLIPAAINNGGGGGGHPRRARWPPRARAPPPAPVPRPAPAPRPRPRNDRAPAPRPDPALRRFLIMVEEDAEDEWDSDELGEAPPGAGHDFDGDGGDRNWDIPIR
ncbi:MAG: translation termination inhibitor protein itt1 [Phylliscum demangeonii]|nr:MAG: translation termination inhibitor protein itt1 [Phylliscum demangeonii]